MPVPGLTGSTTVAALQARHCEERSDEAIQRAPETALDGFAPHAMTVSNQSIASIPCAFSRSRWSFIALSRSGGCPSHSATSPTTLSGSRER